VAKRLVNEAEGALFRCGIGSAMVCTECARTRMLRVEMDSDSRMHEVVFKRLDAMALNLAHANILEAKEWTGEEFVQRLIAAFDATQPDVLRTLSNSRLAHCLHCKKRSEHLKRCSRCHYARYCDATCSAADWPQHKKYECPTLVDNSLLYGGRRNERVL
jgi:radical SAM protein with 4Fe4S-binding SPASM domain